LIERDLLPLFKILSTHGLQGNLKVALLTTNEDLLKELKTVILLDPEKRSFKIKTLQKGPGLQVYILALEGLGYEEAQKLVNKYLYMEIEDLPNLSEEEIYYYQLEGLEVVDKSGKLWGVVSEVMPLGEYELLLVKSPEGGEFYLPLVSHYVEEIDLEKNQIIVRDINDLVEVQS